VRLIWSGGSRVCTALWQSISFHDIPGILKSIKPNVHTWKVLASFMHNRVSTHDLFTYGTIWKWLRIYRRQKLVELKVNTGRGADPVYDGTIQRRNGS
jgi:hypothetical protein